MAYSNFPFSVSKITISNHVPPQPDKSLCLEALNRLIDLEVRESLWRQYAIA